MNYWIVAGILFFLDMGTKCLGKIFLASSSISLLSDFFQLKLTFNEGIAFSLPVPKFLQIFFTLLFLTGFFLWAQKYFSQLSSLEKWGSVFLLSGAVGNFWERVVFGQVTDFLLVSFSFFEFPIFNFADIFIFVGVCLWIWGGFREKK